MVALAAVTAALIELLVPLELLALAVAVVAVVVFAATPPCIFTLLAVVVGVRVFMDKAVTVILALAARLAPHPENPDLAEVAAHRVRASLPVLMAAAAEWAGINITAVQAP
jgi:hypothetical protein